MYSIYDFIPIYDEKVQVTGWDHRRQKYPVDYPVCPNQLAHYKSFGSDQRFHVKESKVQEQLRTGADKPDFGIRGIPNPMVNMTTWGTIDIPERYENMDEVTKIPKPLRKIDIMPKYTSTYKHHYRGTFFGTKIPLHMKNEHHMINRRCKSEFIYDLKNGVTCKFMDDHILCPLPDVKCMKQLRREKHTSYNSNLYKYGF